MSPLDFLKEIRNLRVCFSLQLSQGGMSKTLAWILEFNPDGSTGAQVLNGDIMWSDVCLGCGEGLGWKDCLLEAR